VTPSLLRAIDQARQELLSDPSHDLSPKARLPILRELGQSRPGERWGDLGLGHRRRARLCDLIVRRGLPIWEEEDDTQDPHQLSALCEGYFAGQVGRETLYREMNAMVTLTENMSAPELLFAFMVGRSAVCAALVALFDERLYPTRDVDAKEFEEPQDPDNYDCAIWGAAAEAGGFSSQPAFDAQKSLAFWTWYLDDAVPAAFDSAAG
jgi:hypothetical protein